MIRRVYQPRAFFSLAMDHLASHPRVALFAGMGMGKSSLTLTYLDRLHNVWGESRPTLVLAPLRVARDGWPDEARKWDHLSGLNVVPVIGTREEREAALRRDAPVYTTNYDNLVWLRDHFAGKAWPFKTCVADESTKLKGFRLRQGGVRAQAIAEMAHTQFENWINLTGAPAPNGLKDLWGQTWFLDEGKRLGRTFDAFEGRWFGYRRIRDAINKREHIQTVIFPHSQDEIQARLQDICLTLDPKDWFDLKDPIVTKRPVKLSANARKHYRNMEKELFTELRAGVNVEAFNTASRDNKCRQIANGAMYFEPVPGQAKDWIEVDYAKIEELESIVEEAAGMPVLVSYVFKSDLSRLLKHFPKGVDLSTREGMAAFKSGQAPLGFGHPQSIGHGVDGLQDVTNIIAFFGTDWDMDTHDQIIERIGPMRQLQSGHNRGVFVYYILAEDTLDEAVLERHETKRDVQTTLLNYMKRKAP